MRYFSQKKAWSDSVTASLWFKDVFLPFIDESTQGPVLLIMDNHGSHAFDDPRGRVKVFASQHHLQEATT